MTNFDTFLSTPQFSSFAPVAVSAERILPIDPSACVLNCRRAMEFAVKWMYSVDKALVMPYQDTLVSLMNTEDFRDIVGADIWRRMDLIRRMGNNAAHTGKKITQEQAALCLENLYVFLDFVAYCYGENYTEGHFDPALLTEKSEASAAPVQEAPEVELAALMAENAALKEELTARRAEQQQTYVPKPLDLSEYKTRKLYIDTMLTDAGWTEGKDWLNEVELPGMPNKSEVGYADYVLCGDDGRPLAVVEAKRTCVDVAKGRQQAKLYADLLEKKYHRRPVIFLTNGFETRITDNLYPERKCAAIYSKRDLEKLFNLQSMRTSLKNIMVDHKIAGRYYQEGAIKAACDAFARNRRKALLVMATGSGKTRTVIALCDVLLQHGWVKNILFLADRNSLVTQAKRSFVNLLPDLSVTNLCEEKDNYTAHCVFSTYQTMYNVIDSVQDEEGKLFTCGHFDLVICDEAHRSVYNKYRDIFNYFDAPLVGLTATPKDEIDKNTYEIFELENGVPTYGYELAQAVKDGYLVDFLSVETKLKFMEQGIVYDDLSDADKRAYEDTFEDENKISIKVIDYKSGNTKFDLIRVYRGLQLQLVVYMDAAMEMLRGQHPKKEILPGGILYYHIDDPVLESDTPLSDEEAEQALLFALRPDGLVNSGEEIYRAMDQNFEGKSQMIPVEIKKNGEISTARSKVASTEEFAVITRYVEHEIRQCGEAIYAGNIAVNPYRSDIETSCTYCPYASVCGMDAKIPGYEYRQFASMKKEEVLDQMQTELARNRGKEERSDEMDEGTAGRH